MIMPNKSYKILSNGLIFLNFEIANNNYSTSVGVGFKANITYLLNGVAKQIYGRIKNVNIIDAAEGNNKIVFTIRSTNIPLSQIISVSVIEAINTDASLDSIGIPVDVSPIKLTDLLVSDSGEYFNAKNAETVLQEIGSRMKALYTSKVDLSYIDNLVMSLGGDSNAFVTPESFGAIGDDDTFDCTDAMQRAIDYCSGYSIDLAADVHSIPGFINVDGDILTDVDLIGNWRVYDKIEIKPNVEYSLEGLSNSLLAHIVLYDIGGNITRSIQQYNIEPTLTTAANEVGIIFSSENAIPVMREFSDKGRILFLNRKKYRISNKLIVHKPVTILGASTTESILYWVGGNTVPEIAYDLNNYHESNSLITLKCDYCTLQNFTITNGAKLSAEACNWNGIIMHYVDKEGAVFYTGTARHSIEKIIINGFKNGIFIYAGWNRCIINCNIVNCKNGGVHYDSLEGSNWSASGDTLQDCQFIGNGVGLWMVKCFETVAQNCVFEYNGNAIKTYGCIDSQFISCWNEANVGNIIIDGSAKFYGGYNINKDTITHIDSGNAVVILDKIDEVIGIKGTEIVFHQLGGIIIKGVSLGSTVVNMLENPSFGTNAAELYDPWVVEASGLTSIDSVITYDGANSVLIDTTGETWESQPCYGIVSPTIAVAKNTDLVVSCYVRTEDKSYIDMGVKIEVMAFSPEDTYDGNLVSNYDVTPISNNVWSRGNISFNTGNYEKVRIKYYIRHFGKAWIAAPMLSMLNVSSDNISIKRTGDPNVFNVIDYLGNVSSQLVNKEYVDQKLDEIRLLINP